MAHMPEFEVERTPPEIENTFSNESENEAGKEQEYVLTDEDMYREFGIIPMQEEDLNEAQNGPEGHYEEQQIEQLLPEDNNDFLLNNVDRFSFSEKENWQFTLEHSLEDLLSKPVEQVREEREIAQRVSHVLVRIGMPVDLGTVKLDVGVDPETNVPTVHVTGKLGISPITRKIKPILDGIAKGMKGAKAEADIYISFNIPTVGRKDIPNVIGKIGVSAGITYKKVGFSKDVYVEFRAFDDRVEVAGVFAQRSGVVLIQIKTSKWTLDLD
ncbi:hypothetical protein ALTERO38_20315 [Alteromonas sp. 38]|uniref:hypothetical protein n=1 Tax=unclassified Alteromonas TaxID=2614992 RepID=UPI0012F16731|nr:MULTISPECIES: hypothetical protein [unclassified Alteromonas]CAD5254139.1 hypothetical protein ALTER154_100222 [Alteromonas sp. 154]VXB05622.1 hypothetical protein ALTERO38_20315 [Alteromonas sp. 38]